VSEACSQLGINDKYAQNFSRQKKERGHLEEKVVDDRMSY
jgi:hypothetical protein